MEEYYKENLAGELEKVDPKDITDGYHTFRELYRFRMLYNAALFNEWWQRGLYDVHKSMRHSDGEFCFGGGWFIVMAQLPGSGQISNHYAMKYWDLFDVEDRFQSAEFDGHTAKDVDDRLFRFLPGHKIEPN